MEFLNRIKQLTAKQLVLRELLPLGIALTAVDWFAHLGSFGLECLLFLGLWAMLKFMVSTFTKTSN